MKDITKGTKIKVKISNFINIGEDICIDPGSDFISIYISGRGLVLREPSVIAYNTLTNELAAVGEEACEMEEKAPEAIKTIRPIQNGIVTDVDITGELLAGLISKVRKNYIIKPRIMLSLPCGLSDVEGRAAINAAIKAGARQVIVIEAPVAAALGAGCDVSIARGLMVLDIGGAKSEMAAISLCNSVVSKKINTSGNSFLKDIKEFMLKRHNLEIGTKTARLIKDELCLLSPFTEKNLDVFGVDSSTHMPRKVRIFSRETEGIFDEHIDELASLIRDTLDIVPPELLGDILADGILLVGGATFGTLSEKLSEKSGIKIFPADDIALCTIKGTGIALEHLEELPNIAQSYHNL